MSILASNGNVGIEEPAPSEKIGVNGNVIGNFVRKNRSQLVITVISYQLTILQPLANSLGRSTVQIQY